MYSIYYKPSFFAHIIGGLLLLFAFIILCINYLKIINLDPYKIIILILIFSISIGIHGLSHLGLEKNYNYNPIINMIDN
jgi:tetrahydromethanopterin S-methyltransferase subunit E